ncbi:hypothetical protein [Streptomyces sp. NPDC059349]|uniref:hypothetical protein n=1 Tax=Streptomyces sp. NPDC059349 TaxID=3346808 RepID=UPI0036822DB5
METALASMRDLACFLVNERDKRDRALVDVHDTEAFWVILPGGRKRRLTVLRQFLRFVRARKVAPVDPTLWGSKTRRCWSGSTRRGPAQQLIARDGAGFVAPWFSLRTS